MRYTFDEGDDEDADADSDSAVRRSTRNSARESSTAPQGPTVTSSGRHVRSRATGVYGESLLSGQTTDHASPGTGEYVRSEGEAEEEGRATRGGRGKKRTFDSYNEDEEDEEDATSWPGDDEASDDQMDVDASEPSDNEVEDTEAEPEPEEDHLIVRLKVPRSFSKDKNTDVPSSPPHTDTAPASLPPSTSIDASRLQPVLASAPLQMDTLPAPIPPPTALVDSVPGAVLPPPPMPPAPVEFSAMPLNGVGVHNGVSVPQIGLPLPVEPAVPVEPVAVLPNGHVPGLGPLAGGKVQVEAEGV